MGYGFLIFNNKEDAEKALLELNGKAMPNTTNKTFKLNHASFNSHKSGNDNSIYVCDLSHSVTSERLLSFFKSKYKSVTGAKIIIDPSTKLSKGYGFVSFSDEMEKDRAIMEMDGKFLNDKAIKTGNACYKKFDRKKSRNILNQQLFIQQQYQQFFSNPYFLANNYYANFFNPLFHQQLLQLEQYFDSYTDSNPQTEMKNM